MINGQTQTMIERHSKGHREKRGKGKMDKKETGK